MDALTWQEAQAMSELIDYQRDRQRLEIEAARNGGGSSSGKTVSLEEGVARGWTK